MKKISYLILLLSMSFMWSCQTVYLANSSIEPIVFSKPIYQKSDTTTSFIGAKINRSDYSNGYSNANNNTFGQANMYQTYTSKYYNFSYGILAYYGEINTDDNYETSSYKNYFGGGASADAQITVQTNKVVFRPLGLRTAVLYEDGEFRKHKQIDLSSIGLYADKLAVSLSETFGMDYKLKNSSIGLNFSYGYTLSIPHYLMDMGYSSSIDYSTNKFSIFLQKSGTLIMSSDDIVLGISIRIP